MFVDDCRSMKCSRAEPRSAPARSTMLARSLTHAARPEPFFWSLMMIAIPSLIALAPAAYASTLAFKADLSGGGEAPPNDSVGRGHVNAALDTETKTLTWTVTYSGVTGAPIGAHFHGPVSYIGLTSEENAPIQVGTPGSLASPFKGNSTIDDTQMKDLKDGRWYFNLHTPKFPAGEIRGPVVRQ